MLDAPQLAALNDLFRQGSADASRALSTWIGRPARILVDRVEQSPLSQATEVLGDDETPVCACSMRLSGRVAGLLLLVFDDASGFALADLLTDGAAGRSQEWGELETSAALETANIIGCAYLNALARGVSGEDDSRPDLLPDPPRFARDFAQALLQFAVMSQALAGDVVFLTRTEFQIEGSSADCKLLLIPDGDGQSALCALLT